MHFSRKKNIEKKILAINILMLPFKNALKFHIKILKPKDAKLVFVYPIHSQDISHIVNFRETIT